MTDPIDLLNARLGQHLGYRGNSPRFAWQWAPDLYYYWRPSFLTGFVRQCWADQIGKVWVLCQWRRPEMTNEQWWASFNGEFPYPDKGMYYAHPETALPPGARPTSELTQEHIRALEIQMGTSPAGHLRAVNERVARRAQADDDAYYEATAEIEPAMGNWEPGKKRGVEFQVPGLSQPATEKYRAGVPPSSRRSSFNEAVAD